MEYKYVYDRIIKKIKRDDPNFNLIILKSKEVPTEYLYNDTCTCGHKGIKYMSYIQNTNNKIIYPIGSRCIVTINKNLESFNLNNNFNEVFTKLYNSHTSKITCKYCNKKMTRQTYNTTHKKTKKHIINKRGDRFINVAYKDKDKAKRAGAKWDSIKKSWYIPKNLSTHDYEYNYNKFSN